MKYLLSIIIVLFTSTAGFSQDLIAVHDGNNSTFYEDLDSAVIYAPANSTIYIPGGTYSLGGAYQISKPLSIIGVGIHVDSSSATGITLINSSIKLLQGSSGFSIEGVYLTGSIQIDYDATSIDNISITRCHLTYLSGDQTGTSSKHPSSGIIKESIISNRMPWCSGCFCSPDASLQGMENWEISNSLIFQRLYGISDCKFYNNLFLESARLVRNVNGNEFTNNIFLPQYFVNSYSGCTQNNSINANNFFYNNIFIDSMDIGINQFLSNNLFYPTVNDVFTHFPGTSFNNSDWNYEINPSGPAIGNGLNGEDIGHYGGRYPWKKGSIPHNPHIQYKSIGGTTTPQGGLNINIKVEAQDN